MQRSKFVSQMLASPIFSPQILSWVESLDILVPQHIILHAQKRGPNRDLLRKQANMGQCFTQICEKNYANMQHPKTFFKTVIAVQNS